jgi:hypothetical protein
MDLRSRTDARRGGSGLQAPRADQYVHRGRWDYHRELDLRFADHDPCWGSYIDNLHVAATLYGRGI